MDPPAHILEIPGNEHALTRLRTLLDSGDALAFVGAGASVPVYPLWPRLIRLLADEALARGLANEDQRRHWLANSDQRPHQIVRAIKEAFGHREFAGFIDRVFGYRDQGDSHTPVQVALMRLPFRGYVTTNYDPGLLEARRLTRLGVRATGYATWKDRDLLYKWLDGTVFGQSSCPIMYAHGIHEKALDTVVLGAAEYREAYRPGQLFRRVVEKLWAQERLVFCGFGFTDDWFGLVADEVLAATAHQSGTEPRHIAILGVPRDSMVSLLEIRREFRDAYMAEVLVYPVAVTKAGSHDHSELLTLLVYLCSGSTSTTASSSPQSSPSEELATKWSHATTEDHRYTPPADAIARLDRWAADPAVRAIAITGIGGLGKTALIGHWLKEAPRSAAPSRHGLFAWSFNTDHRLQAFFAGLAQFCRDQLGIHTEELRPAAAAVTLLRMVPLIVVLDGLEVLQEAPGDTGAEVGGPRYAYGRFLEPELREFLYQACDDNSNQGLIVLTSRFPFADLDGFLGTSVRRLSLTQLTPGEGALLLTRCGIGGDDNERRAVARKLNGHPLAIRAFAATAAREPAIAPTVLIESVFNSAGLDESDSLETKVLGVLAFYEGRLPSTWRAMLGVVALFPDQVSLKTIRRFSHDLGGPAQCLRAVPEQQFRTILDALSRDGLTIRERDVTGAPAYVCHSIVRAHFRSTLLGQHADTATAAANLLMGTITGQVETIEQARWVINAISLLLDAGDVTHAQTIYVQRFDQGLQFLKRAWTRGGLVSSLMFTNNRTGVGPTAERLTVRELAFHYNWQGLFARNLAELSLAEQSYETSEALWREGSDSKAIAIVLQNRAELMIDAGRLVEAEQAAREECEVALNLGDLQEIRKAFCWLGAALDAQGRIADALSAFAKAESARETHHHPGLSRVWATLQHDLLIRLGRTGEARPRVEANLFFCARAGWEDDVGRCHRLLGRLETLEGGFDGAAAHLAAAEMTLRDGDLLAEMPQVLLAMADLDRRSKKWAEASRHVNEALGIAGPRGMKLRHADALILRGRITLEQRGADDADRSIDDANEALQIAQECAYAWGERDATSLLADGYGILRRDADTDHYRRQTEILRQSLEGYHN